MKVIVLNGVARSGKDSYADFIINHSKKAVKISTVDKVKEVCQDIFGVDPNKKTNKNRKLWSDFKDLWSNFNNGPFNQIVNFIEKSDKNIFCVFVREPTEIQKFKDYYMGDCITILIRRSDLEIPNNHADQNVENYEYDYYIYNRSLKQLEDKAKELLHKIQGLECYNWNTDKTLTKNIKHFGDDLKISHTDFKKYYEGDWYNSNDRKKI